MTAGPSDARSGVVAATPGRPVGPGRRWRIDRVPVTGSTNADLAAAAAAGAPDGTVLVTDEQTAGRGRLGRRWHAPPGSSLMFSVLLRPGRVPVARRGWVGAILGLAIVEAIRETTTVRPRLKWPNDVLIGQAKVAGILAELLDDAVVVGSGINVSQSAAELPVDTATSLALSGAPGLRCDDLLAQVLGRLDGTLAAWEGADGDVTASGILHRYRDDLATLGSAVTVHLPGDRRVGGVATDVTPDGRLVVVDDGGTTHAFAAGDVVHVRR